MPHRKTLEYMEEPDIELEVWTSKKERQDNENNPLSKDDTDGTP
jgi:hypothetical protein